ncbi:MAG: histidine phosphatase family protein [Ardenticatenaceae bacterium]
MTLYLIRHAQSVNNAIYLRTGSYKGGVPDPDLTEIGHQQAQRLAQLLADESAEPRKNPFSNQTGFGLTHLYCSLMTRTIQSAMYIAEACGLRLTALDNTFERGGISQLNEDGIRVGLPGPKRHYFEERFPTLILPESMDKAGWYGSRPFETESMFVERMKKVVPEILNRHAGTEDSVALVAHGRFIDQFVNQLMGVERHPNNYATPWKVNWAFHNTSISRIDFAMDCTLVIYLNRIDHLSADLITW